MLAEQREQAEGLRPYEEITRNVTKAIQVQKCNPGEFYSFKEAIGQGAFGQVYRAERKSDGKHFALKYVSGASANEKQTVINEASLIAYLDSEEIIKCVDLYEYNNKIWIILEFMENGPLTKMVLDE